MIMAVAVFVVVFPQYTLHSFRYELSQAQVDSFEIDDDVVSIFSMSRDHVAAFTSGCPGFTAKDLPETPNVSTTLINDIINKSVWFQPYQTIKPLQNHEPTAQFHFLDRKKKTSRSFAAKLSISYKAEVAPSKPKSDRVTNGATDQRTDGPTGGQTRRLIESRCRD